MDTLGTTEIEMDFRGRKVFQTAYVLNTNAFEAILGLDFLATPPCRGLLTEPKPCRLSYDGMEIPLKQWRHFNPSAYSLFKVTKVFRSESYTLITPIRIQCLPELGVNPLDVSIDMFANHLNHIHSVFLTRSPHTKRQCSR